MNGPDLAAEIQRRGPATKMVYMTGYAQDAFKRHAGLAEHSHVIQKPFRKADLARAIRKALDEA
jgi:two-component system cell cycle sensor histidine kinase/response regulator CckA